MVKTTAAHPTSWSIHPHGRRLLGLNANYDETQRTPLWVEVAPARS